MIGFSISCRFLLAASCAGVLAICGCCDHRLDVNRARPVSALEFSELYSKERPFSWHYTYLGRKGEYHLMALYGIVGAGSSAQYLHSVRTPVLGMPPDFPSTPQSPLTYEPRGQEPFR